MPRPTDSATLDASDLQKQLEEKNQLVQALTERLEEAAEQLDRIHRTGGDRGGRSGGSGGGLAPEVLAQQKQLIEEVSKSVELWDGLQPKDAFERIEMRLDELCDLLEGSAVPMGGEIGDTGGTAKKTDDTSLSGWEKMKAELMDENAAATPAESPEPSPAPAPVIGTATPTTVQVNPPPLESLAEVDVPDPVDFDVADRKDLENAIEVRNQYIGYLTRRLRSAESRTRQPIDWEALNNAPDELRESLQSLESELEDRLRIAEVDLSLERARLSRVETRVRAMQVQIQNRLATSAPGEAPDGSAPPPAPRKKSSKGWFGSRKG